MTKIDTTLIAPCGIYCGRCDIYLAALTGDTATQEKIAAWLKKHHDVDVSPAQICCKGCWGPLGEHWSPDCKVLACVKEKGYKTCAECPESETCEMLQSFYASGDYKSAQQTLERIREVGVEQWAKEQEAEEQEAAE